MMDKKHNPIIRSRNESNTNRSRKNWSRGKHWNTSRNKSSGEK